jgi:hypothetical protein
MKDGDPHDTALLANGTSPKRLAQEILPLLKVKFLKETAETLRRLVQPSDIDLKVLQTKLGAARPRAFVKRANESWQS